MARYRTLGHWQERDDASGKVLAGETFTCCHCNDLVDIFIGAPPPGVRGVDRAAIAMCHACWAPVCNVCHADGRCRPYEARMALLEQAIKQNEMHAAGIRRLFKLMADRGDSDFGGR